MFGCNFDLSKINNGRFCIFRSYQFFQLYSKQIKDKWHWFRSVTYRVSLSLNFWSFLTPFLYLFIVTATIEFGTPRIVGAGTWKDFFLHILELSYASSHGKWPQFKLSTYNSRISLWKYEQLQQQWNQDNWSIGISWSLWNYKFQHKRKLRVEINRKSVPSWLQLPNAPTTKSKMQSAAKCTFIHIWPDWRVFKELLEDQAWQLFPNF